MKLKLYSLLASVILSSVPPAAADAILVDDIRIIVSPFASKAHQQTCQQKLLVFVLEDAPADTKILVHDGWKNAAVAKFEIPNLAVDSVAGRKARLRLPLAKLLKWFEECGTAATPLLKDSGVVKIPEALESVSAGTGPSTAVALLGSPIYINQAEPAFSFRDVAASGRLVNYVPSDGHLGLGKEGSPFGVLDKRDALDRVSVHFLYPSGTPFETEFYREKIRRWWSLFIAGQGGKLVTFQSDLAGSFDRILDSGLRAPKYRVEPGFDKVEMLSFVRTADRRIIETSAPVDVDGNQAKGEFLQETIRSVYKGSDETAESSENEEPSENIVGDKRAAPVVEDQSGASMREPAEDPDITPEFSLAKKPVKALDSSILNDLKSLYNKETTKALGAKLIQVERLGELTVGRLIEFLDGEILEPKEYRAMETQLKKVSAPLREKIDQWLDESKTD